MALTLKGRFAINVSFVVVVTVVVTVVVVVVVVVVLVGLDVFFCRKKATNTKNCVRLFLNLMILDRQFIKRYFLAPFSLSLSLSRSRSFSLSLSLLNALKHSHISPPQCPS